MSNIQKLIFTKYHLDIDKEENIFKLYRIDNPNITDEEVEIKIEEARRRWNQSKNGANEKNAARDSTRLDKADKYEKILRDKKLRNELYNYYNLNKEKKGNSPGELDLAKKFFGVINKSKNISKKDVDFYFDYFQKEKLNKKVIVEYLKKEFNVKGLGKVEEEDEEGKEQKKSSKDSENGENIVVNLFQKETIMLLRKCINHFEDANKSETVVSKFPSMKEGIDSFLELDEYDAYDAFKSKIQEEGKEIYSVRQENGSDFISLVDMFNNLNELLEKKDVKDNFAEFVLQLKYPELTPYMFLITKVTKEVLNSLMLIAKEHEYFYDLNEFITSYYEISSDNFGLTNVGIDSIINKANKKNNNSKESSRKKLKKQKYKDKVKLYTNLKVLFVFAYWPVLLFRNIFKVFKFFVQYLVKMSNVIFILVFYLTNFVIMKKENLIYSLSYVLNKEKWYSFINQKMNNFFGNKTYYSWTNGGLESFVLSIAVILCMLGIIIIPAYLCARFVFSASIIIHEDIDWNGFDRGFDVIIGSVKSSIIWGYEKDKKAMEKFLIKKAILNIVFVLMVIFSIKIVPVLFRTFSEKTGYFR